MSLNIFNYNIYLTTTHFELLPLTGTNHCNDYNTMQINYYCWYFIWLGLQLEISKYES